MRRGATSPSSGKKSTGVTTTVDGAPRLGLQNLAGTKNSDELSRHSELEQATFVTTGVHSRQTGWRSATAAGKIDEAVFPDVHAKVQTAPGTLIRRPTWLQPTGSSRRLLEI